MFQDGALFDSMNVGQNVAFPLRERGEKDEQVIAQKVADALQVVGLAGQQNKMPVNLSGGMRKRVALAREAINGASNVSVDGYDGLTVDYARRHGLGVIVRGLRAVSDFEYEFQLASMNRHLENSVETVFLTPAEEYTFISSTFVREVGLLGGDISGFVHPVVVAALAAKRRQRVR